MAVKLSRAGANSSRLRSEYRPEIFQEAGRFAFEVKEWREQSHQFRRLVSKPRQDRQIAVQYLVEDLALLLRRKAEAGE